jgi:hypothetical protein
MMHEHFGQTNRFRAAAGDPVSLVEWRQFAARCCN